MILGIDIGNSNAVLSLIDGKNITATGRISTHEDIGVLLDRYLNIPLKYAVLSSVVPDANRDVIESVRDRLGIETKVIDYKAPLGYRLAVDNPEEVGTDILMGLTGAVEKYGKPVVVIDLGTATTIFAVNREGVFCGGTIHPGVRLEMRALTTGTAQLPNARITPPKKVLATTTKECMRSGVFYGHAGMIDMILDKAEEELGYGFPAVATGGLAETVIPHCRHQIALEKDLIMQGLGIIADRMETGSC